MSKDEDLNDNSLYFYDLNAKINCNIGENDRIFISSYLGRDIFKNPDFKMNWGNQTITLRWNHLFSQQLFSNFTVISSRFDYGLGIPEGKAESFKWISRLDDYAMKADFGYYPNPGNTIRFGLQSAWHTFTPGSAKGIGDNTFFNEFILPASYALEHAVYAQNEQQLTSRLSLRYGARFSLFQNMGKGVVYRFDEQYEAIDSTVYTAGKIFNHYAGLEPRLAVTWMLDSTASLKASYSRTLQYVHLASNSASGNPLDVWFPSSPNVKPQKGDQLSAGYFRNFLSNQLETSVEAYYKKNHHSVDFKDHAELLLNPRLEGELRFGETESYGLEFYIRLQKNRLNGWISYTLSRSMRKTAEINGGSAYRSPYDRPHNVSVVVNYTLGRRTNLGANWVYASGQPVTFPTGRAVIGNKIVPVYSDRNAYRMPAYHRLDLSLTLRSKEKTGRKWFGEWNFSIYNAYARKNAWTINFETDPDNPDLIYAEKTYLFSIIPSITYNFNF